MYLRYRKDVFFSTRTKIILSQIALIGVVIAVTAKFHEYTTDTLQSAFISFVNNAILSGDTSQLTFNDITHDVETAQFGLYAIALLTTILIGLIATRMALEPVKDSLIAQKRFIESIAHELRTSLAVLRTQNEVAKMDTDLPDTATETLDQNIKEIDHITEILNNLLLFNRVDTIDKIVFDSVDLQDVIETVISRLRRFAEHKNVNLVFERSDIPAVYGNATGIEQMLFNLVKNGISYTNRTGTVTVSCIVVSENDVTIRVADNGIGIEKDELPRIFKLFYRTDTVQEISSGTGLGLALVYEIVKLHNGKIRVNSTPGVGTQFDVTIPRSQTGVLSNDGAHDAGLTFDFSKKHVETV